MMALLDTDCLMALFNRESFYHVSARSLSEQLSNLGVESVVLPTTINEVSLLLAPHIGKEQARLSLSSLVKSGVSVLEITQDVTRKAFERYNAAAREELLLSECYVMAAAEKLSVDCIFSFSTTYPKKGFVVAEAFVRDALPALP